MLSLPPIHGGEWGVPRTDPTLRDGDVHLWLISLDDPTDDFALTPAEKERASRFVFERDRSRWTASRAALRAILAKYAGLTESAIEFSLGEHGKPSLAVPCGISFNLSHSADRALVAVAKGSDIGVDIEAVRRDFDPLNLAPSVFSADEIYYIRSSPSTEQADRFFDLWTLKEAWLKMLGCGLVDDLPSHSVFAGLPNSHNHSPTNIWRINVGDSFRAALASPVSHGELSCFAYHSSVRGRKESHAKS